MNSTTTILEGNQEPTYSYPIDIEKIRQEAIEEFKNGLLEELNLLPNERRMELTLSYVYDLVESYNLPIKQIEKTRDDKIKDFWDNYFNPSTK